MMSDTFRMVELAQKGFYCSQILLCMGLEAQGKENPDLIRTMGGLAGGLGFSGDVCGALTGGACLIALFAGRGTEDEEENPRLNVMINELVEWFTEEFGRTYGGIHCENILGEEPGNRSVRCPALVIGVYEKVKALLAENEIEFGEQQS
jgi:C_GCAxxG_C_C family probable redox protein